MDNRGRAKECVWRVRPLSYQDVDLIIICQCHEFEGQWLQLLEDLHHMPILPVGLMSTLLQNSSDDNDETLDNALKNG